MIKKNLKIENLNFSQALLEWYDHHQRTLPWRSDPTPYKVWMSEIMLQQTQVVTVIPYFERFIKAFPNFQALAEADEDLILKMWEGLGYYNRARNMKRCAEILVYAYEGRLPDTRKELESLPGIGPYTAGAILSIAFGRRELAADGNLYRVMARLTNEDGDLRDSKVLKSLRKYAISLMPYQRLSDYTQAIFEQGALICLPRNPDCNNCSISSFCQSYRHRTQDLIPYKSKAPKKNIRTITVVRIDCEDKTAIRKRDDHNLMGGLWELLTLEGHLTINQIQESFQNLGYKVNVQVKGKRKVLFTHIDWRIQDLHLVLADKRDKMDYSIDSNSKVIEQYLNTCLWIPMQNIRQDFAFSTVYLQAFSNDSHSNESKDSINDNEDVRSI